MRMPKPHELDDITEIIWTITRTLLVIFAVIVGLSIIGCNPFPPVTPDEAVAETCPCPVSAIQNHPEDPGEAPGEGCWARSRTGQWMDAREHPACQREARGEKGVPVTGTEYQRAAARTLLNEPDFALVDLVFGGVQLHSGELLGARKKLRETRDGTRKAYRAYLAARSGRGEGQT